VSIKSEAEHDWDIKNPSGFPKSLKLECVISNSRFARTSGIILLSLGSLLLYVVCRTVLVRIFDLNALLQHEHFLAAGGLMLWAGTSLCPQWRMVLGSAWMALGLFSFLSFHSPRAFVSAAGAGRVGAGVLLSSAHEKAGWTLAIASLALAACFLLLQRMGRNPETEAVHAQSPEFLARRS
jgi:hypothetical protein